MTTWNSWQQVSSSGSASTRQKLNHPSSHLNCEWQKVGGQGVKSYTVVAKNIPIILLGEDLSCTSDSIVELQQPSFFQRNRRTAPIRFLAES